MWLSISSATISTTELTESKTNEYKLRIRKDSASQSQSNASGCNEAHGILHFVFREYPCQVGKGTHAPEFIRRPVNTFANYVFIEHTQLCNLGYVRLCFHTRYFYSVTCVLLLIYFRYISYYNNWTCGHCHSMSVARWR